MEWGKIQRKRVCGLRPHTTSKGLPITIVPVHISIHAPIAKGATLWRVHRRRTGEVIRHGLVLPTVFTLLPMGVIRHAHPLTRKYVYIIQYFMNIAKLIAHFNYICHAPRFLFVPAVV